MILCSTYYPCVVAEREERERIEQEAREAEEAVYQERLAKLEEQERKQRARQQEIEERERRREEEMKTPARSEEKPRGETKVAYYTSPSTSPPRALSHSLTLPVESKMTPFKGVLISICNINKWVLCSASNGPKVTSKFCLLSDDSPPLIAQERHEMKCTSISPAN